MKKHSLFLLLAVAGSIGSVNAANISCDDLKDNIQKQIEITQNDESDNDLLGYTQALNDLTKQCNIDELVKATQAEIPQLKQQISKLQIDVSQSEEQLAQALNVNDEKKITEYEEVVGEKQQILLELQDKLEIAQAKLQALTADGSDNG